MRSSWENVLGLSWWIVFLFLLIAKTTELIELEWVEVFLPLIAPIVLSVFVLLIGVFLCIFVGFILLGTIIVMELLEKFK